MRPKAGKRVEPIDKFDWLMIVACSVAVIALGFHDPIAMLVMMGFLVGIGGLFVMAAAD